MPIRFLNQIDPNRPSATKPVFGKNALSVLVIYAAIFFIIVVGGAFALAKTGIVTVPYFSDWYSGPEPVRAVRADTIDATAFRVIVSGRLLSQTADLKPPPYAITLTEQELTGALSGVIDQALRDQSWKPQASQIAVTSEFVEFSGTFTRGNLRADVRVRFIPVVEDGGLRFVTTDVRFGDYPLHPKLAEQLVGLIFARDLGTWVVSLGDIRLQSAVLKTGALELITAERPS